MGACLSCNQSSTHDHQEQKNKTPPNKNKDSVTPTTTTPSSSPPVNVSSSLGAGMRDGESVPHTNNHHHHRGHGNNSATTATTTSSTSNNQDGTSAASLKGDKKNFYSRIPPLGRVGSTSADKDKGPGGGGKTGGSSITIIKDNNNAYSESKIAALFQHYKDPLEDAVLAEGIDRLCKDLEVKPEDFKMLVLAWKFDAEQMCRFSRQEFFQGMKTLKTDTLPGIQARLPDIVTQLGNDPVKFKDLYRFSFKFGLESELSQRVLPIEMATSLWRVVFSQKEPPILERWITFLESNPSIRGIPRDTWNMFLNLVETVGSDLSNYDDTEAWPSLFDDFVEFENDALNQNTINTINSSSSDGKPTSTSPTSNHHLNNRLTYHPLQ